MANQNDQLEISQNVFESSSDQDLIVNPFDQINIAPSDASQRNVRSVQNAVMAADKGEDPITAYVDIEQVEPGIADELLISEVKSRKLDDTVAAIETIISDGEEVDIDAARQVVQETEEQFSENNPLAKAEAFILSLEGASQLPSESVKAMAARWHMMNEIAKIADESTFVSTAGDVMGAIALADESYNISATLDKVGTEGLSNYLTSAEGLLKFRQAMDTLPPEQQVVAFDAFRKAYSEVDNNQFQQMIALMELAGDSSAESIQFSQALDKLDAFLTATGIGKLAIGAFKTFSVLQSASRATKASANIVDLAARSPELARTIGVSQIDAAAAMDPTVEALKGTMLKGAPSNIQDGITRHFDEIDSLLREQARIDQIGLRLTESEKAVAEAKIIEKVQSLPGVSDLRVAETTDEGVKVSMTFTGSQGVPVRAESLVRFTVDDITGGFNRNTLTNIGDSLKLAASPNFLFKADRERLVQAFERANFAGKRITEGLNRSMDQALEGLSRKEKARIQKVLLDGDSKSTDFSYDDLVGSGILTDKEFSSFAKVRHVMNRVHSLKNKDVIDSFRAKGIKEFNILGGEKLYGKDYDSAESAISAYNAIKGKDAGRWVFAPEPLASQGEIIKDLTKADLDDYYAQGYRLVRGNDAISLGDTSVKWVLARGDNLRQPSGMILQRKPGYIPRMYKDSFFFVKEARKQSLDGVEGAGRKLVTHRYFDNFEDAKLYRDQLVARMRSRGEVVDDDTFRVLGDREITREELEGDLVNVFGGPFGGHRAEEAIPFGLEGIEGARIDPFEAIQNYFNHIGNRIPLSQYRLAIQQRWLNSAKNAKLLAPDYNGDFWSARQEILKSKGRVSEDLVNFHLLSHDQIRFNLKIPSTEEMAMQSKVRDIGKSLESKGFKGIAKHVYRLDHAKVPDAIRGATFNILLGVFNPAQYFVQMLGATVAISINPVHATAGLPKFLGFKVLDNIKNPVAKQAAIKAMEADKGLKGLGEAYLMWDRSGLRESVLVSNADFNNVAQGLPYGASALRKLMHNHTFFFKAGELDNMRLSFVTSYQKWRTENPDAVADSAALNTIVARTENFRLNMSQANKAAFQRGWTSVPLQFQQVQTKFLESILGDTFTKTERARLMAGQAALFGAAGVPAADALYPYLMDTMGIDPLEMTEEELISHRRGFVGWLFNDFFDVNAVITGRVAIASDFAENIISGLTDWTTLPEAFLGPSFTSGDRILRSMQTFMDATRAVVHTDEVEFQDIAAATGALAFSLAQIPSSTANLIRAYDFANSGMYRNKNGVASFPLLDLNKQTIIAQGLGFSLQEVHDMFELGTSTKAQKAAKSAASDRLVGLMHKMISVGVDESRSYNLAASAILTSFEDPEDKRVILEDVQRKLLTPKDKQSAEVRRIIENWGSELQSATERYNAITIRALERAREE